MYLSTVALCTWHCDKLALRTCTFPTYSTFFVAFFVVCLVLLSPSASSSTCSTCSAVSTHQHGAEALLQLLLGRHGELRALASFLGVRGAHGGRRGLAIPPLWHLQVSCCISHECASNRLRSEMKKLYIGLQKNLLRLKNKSTDCQ